MYTTVVYFGLLLTALFVTLTLFIGLTKIKLV